MEEEAAGAGAAAADAEAADKDDDERELDKLEKSDPEMLRVCTTIIDQLDTFKVRLRARLMSLFISHWCGLNLCLTVHLLVFICTSVCVDVSS